MHSELMNRWTDSVTTTCETLSEISGIAGKTLDRLVKHQIDALSMYLDSGIRQLNASLGLEQANQALPTAGLAEQRIAMVTGGIGGIGTAICRVLGRQGYQVIATYMAQEAEAAAEWRRARRREGMDIAIVECDVSSYESCGRMAEEVETRFGAVDVLVNCAGITRDTTLRKMDKSQWDAVLGANLDSVFNVTRHIVDRMIGRNAGRIINISSVNGQKGQFGQTNYAASKAGMYGFSKALARELAEFGITVNTVSPGYVATQMVMAVPEELRQGIVSKIPMGRLADPDEIARVVAFLASEDSSYITGANIPVNGGLFMG